MLSYTYVRTICYLIIISVHLLWNKLACMATLFQRPHRGLKDSDHQDGSVYIIMHIKHFTAYVVIGESQDKS